MTRLPSGLPSFVAALILALAVPVQVSLNTASEEEIRLIPGAGRRMAHEFREYRPWKSWAEFDKEIGKYVGLNEVARLWRYVVID